ncbi:MAG: hypothetical protein ABJA98_09775 [Acidobacteriota bacterium]
MAAAGSVIIGSKKIDIHAFTGLVTLFWGVVGKKESSDLAVYNHSRDAFGVGWHIRNELAGPAFLQSQLLLSILAILFLIVFNRHLWADELSSSGWSSASGTGSIATGKSWLTLSRHQFQT